MGLSYNNIKEGDTIYIFNLEAYSCFFARGKAIRHGSRYIKIDKIYITSKRYRTNIGDTRKFNYGTLSKKFSTPLKRVVKYKLEKYVIESILNEGEHPLPKFNIDYTVNDYDRFREYKK